LRGSGSRAEQDGGPREHEAAPVEDCHVALTFAFCVTRAKISLRCEITIDPRVAASLISMERWPTMPVVQ